MSPSREVFLTERMVVPHASIDHGSTDPLVHDFASLPWDRPMALLSRQRVIGQHVMISRVVLEKGCDVPLHAHANEQMAFIVSGRLRFVLGADGSPDRRVVTVTDGQVLHLPSNLPHAAFAEERTVVLDIFSPPSATTGIDRT